MNSRIIGLGAGPALFAIACVAEPTGIAPEALRVAALVIWMAIWWMTEALPLTATALLPFLVLPLLGVLDAKTVASAYYSPILFLILGGAFLALAIERSGLHRRLAIFVVRRAGDSAWSLLFAFMAATALLSTVISNTSAALIMMPIVLAVLAGMERPADNGTTSGFPAALIMGVAFAATIGGLGTLVGSPTNAIAAGLIEAQLGYDISFVTWLAFGIPCVLIGVPLAAIVLILVQRVGRYAVDVPAARLAIGAAGPWRSPERRLVPVVALVLALWLMQPLIEPLLPSGALTDGSIAVFGALLLFILPDGTGRPLLNWQEADRAPWGVIMMFGGGLALAEGIAASGLATWLGQSLEPLRSVPVILVALILVTVIVIVTEFASNVAAASATMPVVASLVIATGADPLLLAMPAAIAASWGFMLPSGTGPNAIAWATGRVQMASMLRAGALLDIAGIPMIVGIVWAVTALMA